MSSNPVRHCPHCGREVERREDTPFCPACELDWGGVEQQRLGPIWTCARCEQEHGPQAGTNYYDVRHRFCRACGQEQAPWPPEHRGQHVDEPLEPRED
ncbi:hypothetical protein ACFL2T_01165 [Elusimicrobiota bacterium]